MRNRFHRTLSILGTNFRACSASCKMWTVFTCTIHAEHTRNKFYRTLSIRGTNFIACWAYAEPISSHSEPARKCLKIEYLGRIEYDFQKSRVTGPWDHMVSVSAKKSKKKKNNACVPLRRAIQFSDRFTNLSLEFNHVDSIILFDKKLGSRFKTEITSFWSFLRAYGDYSITLLSL